MGAFKIESSTSTEIQQVLDADKQKSRLRIVYVFYRLEGGCWSHIWNSWACHHCAGLLLPTEEVQARVSYP